MYALTLSLGIFKFMSVWRIQLLFACCVFPIAFEEKEKRKDKLALTKQKDPFVFFLA